MEENKEFTTPEEEVLESLPEAAEQESAEAIPEPELSESVPEPAGTYRGAGAGRRESPFADSPYVVREPYRPAYQEPGFDEDKPFPEKKPGQKRSRGGWLRRVLAWTAVLALVIGSCAMTARSVNEQWEARATAMEAAFDSRIAALQQQLDDMTPENTGNSVSGTVAVANGMTAAQVYANNVRSVVLIESTVTADLYGQTATGVSTGSGFVLTDDGYLVTNFHVVEGATSVQVRFHDGSSYPAALVGYDSTNDLAVLKVEAEGLDPVTVGSSDALIVGDQVVAIGNPLGELTATLTVGYVSAKERTVNTDGTILNMIQTDAAINSGNSGGPLLNMKGEVIGITTAKYSGTSSSGATIEGVGFAIPINDVVDLLNDLMTYGYVNSGYLGVSVSDVDPAIAAYSGIPRGARVEEVVPGYAAGRAGLKLADIIVAVGDHQVRTVSELTRVLRKFAPGDTTTITVYRGGRELVLTITLDEKPDTQSSGQSGEQEPTETDWDYWYEYMKPFFDESKGQSYDEWFEQFKEHFGK